MNSNYLLVAAVVAYSLLYCECAVFTTSEEELISDTVLSMMECRNMPGFSITAVKKDDVFTRGYGVADFKTNRLFDNSTISCLGSTGKAFTVALLGILLTEKRSAGENLSWDTKLKDILGPEFKLPGEFRTTEITLADILSHRTGMATTDYLMMAGFPNVQTSRKEIIGRLRFLPESAPFRTQFIYNNIMYMVMGQVAEILGGKSYEDLIREKIFQPLGMNASVFIDNLFENDNIAKPYHLINKSLEEANEMLYKLREYSPAGGICSSATDLAKWLRFIITKGTTSNGEQLIERSIFSPIFEPHSVLSLSYQTTYSLFEPFPISVTSNWYSLAWFGSSYRGYLRMFHGGNFHSYSAFTAIFPSEDIGLFLTLNGPWPITGSKTYYQFSHFLSDILLKKSPWLNVSTICTYPEPWGSKGFSFPFSGFSDRSLPSIESYTGNYGHPLYGDMEVKIMDESLYLSVGYLMNGYLRQTGSSNDNFLLEVVGPLSTVFTFPPQVMFVDKKSEKYNEVKLVFGFGAETYRFYKGVKFSDNSLGGNLPNKCATTHGRSFALFTAMTIMCVIFSSQV